MSDHAHLAPEVRRAPASPRGRSGLAFGPRFLVLVMVGLVWIGPAFWEPRFLWAMAAWDVLLLAAWAIDLARLPRPSELLVTRRWQAPAALSVPAEIEIEVENRSDVPLSLELLEDVPVALRPEPAEVKINAPTGIASASYTIEPVARGDAVFGMAHLRYHGPVGLAERWAVADLRQTVRIFPNLREARRHTMYLIRARQIEMQKRVARYRGFGREFESLREYREGDERRDVCWTATARRAKLVTKVYQAERSQPVWLVVDAGRLLRARVSGLSKLDFSVNAALSAAQVALYSGDRVGLLAYGRKLQQRVPPGRGADHLRHMIEALALTAGEPSEANHLAAAEWLMREQKRRSLVVWLTDLADTSMTPDVVQAAMRLLPRHLVLFAVMALVEIREVAAAPPGSVESMYSTAAAQEVLHRRELLLSRLRQSGALAFEVEPSGLSAAIINQYLQLKQRSQL